MTDLPARLRELAGTLTGIALDLDFVEDQELAIEGAESLRQAADEIDRLRSAIAAAQYALRGHRKTLALEVLDEENPPKKRNSR